MRRPAVCLLTALSATSAFAHHSVLNYDGKVEITISGTVTSARFGYPHSIYRIDVVSEDGKTEKWTLSTEDPRDAERLGFADELRNLKRGDSITVVGWPDKFRKRTLRGHQLHYPDGKIVMMRRGNYIWPQDVLRMDRMALNPDSIPQGFPSTDPSLPAKDQVLGWIVENDHLTRIAREYADGRPRLIGIVNDGSTSYPGVDGLLACHAERDGFTIDVPAGRLSADEASRIDSGMDYITEYNRVLSRWYEQEIASCE
jgi:hypothetical protein